MNEFWEDYSGEFWTIWQSEQASILPTPKFLGSNSTPRQEGWQRQEGRGSPGALSSPLSKGDRAGEGFIHSSVRGELVGAGRITFSPHLRRPRTVGKCAPPGVCLWRSLSVQQFPGVLPPSLQPLPQHWWKEPGPLLSTGRLHAYPHWFCSAESAGLSTTSQCHHLRKPNCPKGHKQAKKSKKLEKKKKRRETLGGLDENICIHPNPSTDLFLSFFLLIPSLNQY